MVLQPSRPALLLMLSVLVTALAGRETEFCTLGGQRYKMGQTWHPTLQPFGENACINCTCHEEGNVQCQGIDCPRPDCDVPKILAGECCPTCDVGREGSKEEEDVSPGCDFDGRAFKDGDVFPSNSTGLRPTRHDQCVMCVCADGKVFCQLKTCLPTKCKKFKSVPDDCCPQCADESDYTDVYLPHVLSDPKQDNRSDADCSTAMGLHQNGSSWHPVIGIYGVVDCIVCTCLNGDVTCTRLECPPPSSLPCKRPRVRQGSCCKTCSARHRHKDKLKDSNRGGMTPEEDQRSKVKVEAEAEGEGVKKKGRGRKRRKGKGKSKGKKKKKKSGRKGVKGFRQCKASDKQEAAHPHRKANVTSVAAILSELCLPRNTDRLVYRGEEADFVMLAFDNLRTESVQMLRWQLKKGRLQDTERSVVHVDEFRPKITCSQIVGATSKRGFKKLLRKIDSKQRRCKKRGRPCSPRTLQKILKRDRLLKALPVKSVCGE